jgi:hypothetical protein
MAPEECKIFVYLNQNLSFLSSPPQVCGEKNGIFGRKKQFFSIHSSAVSHAIQNLKFYTYIFHNIFNSFYKLRSKRTHRQDFLGREFSEIQTAFEYRKEQIKILNSLLMLKVAYT